MVQQQRGMKSDKWQAEKRYDVDQSFTASERRILLTKWTGEAYENLFITKYNGFCCKLFKKTGCLLTADWTDDELV